MKNSHNSNSYLLLGPLIALGMSCASQVPPGFKTEIRLEPDVQHIPALVDLPKIVGTLYPNGFSTYRYLGRVPGGTEPSFGVGSASIPVFDDVFSKVFSRVIALNHRDTTYGEQLDAIIEPSIQSVLVRISPPLAGRWWFTWGRVTYKFQIRSPSGADRTSWTVTGYKEILGDKRVDTLESLHERVLTGAIEDAGIQFMTSFYKVPEAKRFAKGLSQGGVNAGINTQVTSFFEEGSESTVSGHYPEIARVQARPISDATLAYEIKVENESFHRLLIRPLDVMLDLEDGNPLYPAPVYAYGAMQYPPTDLPHDSSITYLPPPPITLEPSYFGTYNLIFALIKVAEMHAREQKMVEEKGELDTYLKEHRGDELQEKSLSNGQKIEGTIFFIAPETPSNFEKVTMIVPLIDLDTATRFKVRLPIITSGREI